MASTYSTVLKIELITTGEQDGSWGITTNNNLGTAIEEAITGRAAVDFPTDADLTISITDSNSSQAARNLILNVTSTGSLTATRNLNVPDGPKAYIVENNTTGGQSITVKTTGGSGVTVPNGMRVRVYANGTDVVVDQNYFFTPVFAGAQELAVDLGAGVNIDLSLGNYFYKTITGTTTLTLSNIPVSGRVGNFILDLTNGGAHTVNWFSGVEWSKGIPPVLTVSGKDSFGFYTRDGGTTWSSFQLGEDLS